MDSATRRPTNRTGVSGTGVSGTGVSGTGVSGTGVSGTGVPPVNGRDGRSTPHARATKSRGFTLIEVIVVIIIIGVLVTLIVPRLFSRVGQASRGVAEQKLVQIEQAVQMFYYDYNRFPATLDELVNRPADIAAEQWTEPSLRPRDLDDPWGNPFGYRYPGQNGTFDLWSYGADGQPGGEGENADITNWD